ncbi:MAG: TolB family protein [Longimicrobiales bacterium]
MARSIVAGVVLFTLLACEQPPDSPIAQAGLFTTVGAPRSWKLEPPPADTIRTVTRRVWYGESADYLGSPTPDGTAIAFHDWNTGDLAIRDLTTGAIQNLTNNPAPYAPGFGMFPVISQDAQRVAYTWLEFEKPFEWQLRVVDRENPEPRVLHAVEPWIHPTDWSPDNKQVVALKLLPDGTYQIVLVSAEDGSVRVLKQLDWRMPMNMAFSPDGRFVAYDFPADPAIEESRDLFLLPLDGSPEGRLVNHPADDMFFGWAPDGRHILFSSDRTGAPAAWLLRVVDGVAEGSPLLVKPDMWQSVPMGFARDGRFFYGVKTGNQTVRIASLDPETGEAVGPPVPGTARSLGTTSWPSWSPDGHHLAFLLQPSLAQAPRILAIRSIETGEERHLRLPMELNYPTQPLWTPDGRAILLRSQDREGQHGLYRANVLTGETQPVFKKPLWAIRTFDVLAGGDAIVYVSEGKNEAGNAEARILVRNLDSGEEREIHRFPTQGAEEFRQIVLSPDGETVAVLHTKALDADSPANAVLLLSIAGGEPRELLRGSFQNLAWLPNGRFLLLRVPDDPKDSGGGGQRMHLSRVDVKSGQVSEAGLTMDGAGLMALSRDGRRLAYLDGASAVEVWVMENFLPPADESRPSGSGG